MEQTTALNILKSGKNVFLTGSAGAGKTYTLNQYVSYLRAHRIPVAVTASTGIAATQLNGSTIHSWSGIGIKDFLTMKDVNKVKNNRFKAEAINRTKVLIIDEISMLHAKQLAMVDTMLRQVRGIEEPFGGIQVVLTGDFFQLPPVGEEGETNRDKFCFMSPAWINSNLHVCYLDQQYRQSEGPLIEILNAIRSQTVTEDHIATLRETEYNDELGDSPLHLYTHNLSVDLINQRSLRDLEGESKTFIAEEIGHEALLNVLKKSIRAPEVLELKIGAKVMFVKNHPDGLYANGTQGIVTGYRPIDGVQIPVVQSKTQGEIHAKPEDWSIEDESGKPIATFTQIPLRLAYAITVHKCIHPDTYVNTSQGLLPIKDITDTGIIQTEFDVSDYINKVSNPLLSSKDILCERGYSIHVTSDHKCLSFNNTEWKYTEAKDLKINDWFKLKLNQVCDSSPVKLEQFSTKVFDSRTTVYSLPTEIDDEFAELLGLLLSDGTLRAQGFSLTKKHLETVQRFKYLCIKYFNCKDKPIKTLNVGGKDFYQFEVNSRYIAHFLLEEWFPELTSNRKDVPALIQRSPLSSQLSFLKGLYEDGTVSIKGDTVDHIEFTNKSYDVCKFVQQVLLRIGIVTTLSSTAKNMSTLYIYGKYCSIFKDKICFINQFNKDRLESNTIITTDSNSRVPVSNSLLSEWLEKGYITSSMYKDSLSRGYIGRDYVPEEHSALLDFYYIRIKDIVDRECESVCVEVPSCSNFIQNGFVMSNSQGMTLQEAEINLSKTFEMGQGYVAISRLQSIEGLRLTGLNKNSLVLDPLAIKADSRFQELSRSIEPQFEQANVADHKAFIKQCRPSYRRR